MEIRFQQGTPAAEWILNLYPRHDPKLGKSSSMPIIREIDTIEFDGDYGDPEVVYEDKVIENDDPEIEDRIVGRVAKLTFPAPCMGKAVAQLKVVD